MPQELLDHAQVGAAFEEVGREGVPEPVRMTEQPPHVLVSSRRPRAERKTASFAPLASAGRAVAQVARELGARPPRRAARRAPCLPCRARARLALEVDVGEVERDRLGAAQPRGVEELEERTVAERERRVAVDDLEELLDLGGLRRFGQASCDGSARAPRRGRPRRRM